MIDSMHGRNSWGVHSMALRLLISFMLVVVMLISLTLTSAFALDDTKINFPDHINVFDKIDPQGHGARILQAANETDHFYYGTSNDEKIDLAKRLASDGWLTIETKDKQEGGQDHYWVRYTEIVPHGDIPRAVLPNDAKHRLNFSSDFSSDPITRNVVRFVPDDGTFIPPVQSTKIANLGRNFGLEISHNHQNYSAAYTFGTVPTYTYNNANDIALDKQNITLQNNFNDEWLPYNHYGNIVLFSTQNGPSEDGHLENKNNWYWCINPNAQDPRSQYYFVREPTRFSGQTNFQDLPSLAFMLNILNNIHNLGEGNRPDFRPLYKQLLAYYNINMTSSDNDDRPFPWYSGLTNGDIRSVFDELATLDGQPHEVNGYSIPIQADRNAMGKVLPTQTDWGNNRDFTNLGVAIEFYITHHTQGLPITHIDWLTSVRQAGYLRRGTTFPYSDEMTTRAFSRLLLAIEFAAKNKGLVNKYDPSTLRNPFTTALTNVHRDSHHYSAEVDLNRPLNSDSKLLVAVTPGVNIVENTNWKVYTPTTSDAFNNFYGTSSSNSSLKYYEVPNNLFALHINYSTSSTGLSDINAKPHPQIRFIYKNFQRVIGEVYASTDSYEYNKSSGHWLVKEYASYNHGMNTDQQVVSVTPHMEEVPYALALDLVADRTLSLKTKLAIDGISSTQDIPVTLTDDKRSTSKYSLVDTVSYEDMVPGAKYNLTGEVYKVSGDDENKSIVDDPVITAVQTVTVNSQGTGEWQLSLPTSNVVLDPSSRYVVYETATPAESVHNGIDVLKAEHKDPNDNLETFITTAEKPKPDITTVVMANGHTPPIGHSEQGVQLQATDVFNNANVSVNDIVLYKRLKPNADYRLIGKIYEVLIDENKKPYVNIEKPLAISPPHDFNSESLGQGHTVVSFGQVRGMQPGKRYVVFETLTLDKPNTGDIYGTKENPVRHEDPTDGAQTITIDNNLPSLSTRVTADTSAATNSTPASIGDGDIATGINITDSVAYKNFAAGDYILEGKIYAVAGENKKYTIIGNPIVTKTINVHVTEAKSEGKWQVKFDKVTGLHSNTRYVVFETAKFASQSNDPDAKPVAIHQDPNDISQTIVVTHDFLKSVLPVTGGFGHYWYIIIAAVLLLTVFGYLVFHVKENCSLFHK